MKKFSFPGGWFGIGAALGTIALAAPAIAETSVAYCDTTEFAINIFNRQGQLDPEAPGSNDLFMRIYDRQDSIAFINGVQVSFREGTYANTDGTFYTNLRGENEWKLFIPENAGTVDPESPSAKSCVLFRDDDVFATGQSRRI